MPVHVPHVWNLKIPPGVQFFLCLLSKSKVLTRDNLSVHKKVDDMSCLFGEENEHVEYQEVYGRLCCSPVGALEIKE
jgi:hypothetical protein